MKKLITTLFSLFLFLGLSAQTNQGSFLMGANTNLNFTSVTEFSYQIDGNEPEDYEPSKAVISNIKADMKFGVFIINNLALGAVVNYSSDKVDYNSDADNPDPSITTSYGAFARYYIGGVAFVGGSFVMRDYSAWDDWDTNPKENIIALEAGFSLFITDNIAFTPAVAYGIRTQTEEGYYDGDDDVVFLDQESLMNITAGFTIHF